MQVWSTLETRANKSNNCHDSERVDENNDESGFQRPRVISVASQMAIKDHLTFSQHFHSFLDIKRLHHDHSASKCNPAKAG